MAIIRGQKDVLDAEVRKFAQTPLTQPLLVNSVPKGGTHLLRNILRMFVPVEQHYAAEFVQIPNMPNHRAAFDPAAPKLVAGHLLFSDVSWAAVRFMRHLLLVRDPYDWVLARARFFVSDAFEQDNIKHLKTSGVYTADALINMMIFGIHAKSPALADIYTHNAAAWLGSGPFLVKYEDLVAAVKDLDSQQSEALFLALFEAAGITCPGDWRDRVRIGADRRLSRTARENLSLPADISFPSELSDVQKRLVDYHAPGLRGLLGYT